MPDIKAIVSDRDVPLVYISRNPYVRLLSGYIEKHAKGTDGLYWGSKKSTRKWIASYDSDTFSDFVGKLFVVYGYMDKSLSRQLRVNHHFAQQARFCGFDQGLTYDYVLKLERINEWYYDLVEDLGLGDVVQSGWPTKDHCFLSTPMH